MTQELSWLKFNRRVLDQTARPDFPVLERLRFLGIWASNLDEFFAARVSRMFLEGRETEGYRIPRFDEGPFARVDRGDLLLFHPYQSYEAVETFARVAAKDPAVTAIRATLYRVGEDNVLARALVAGARAGKDVAVLLEARARFDELTNMEWALRLRNSGVRVLPLPEKKVHAKVFWVRRGNREYIHIGTGNYNTANGRLYTDYSLFTCDHRLTSDVKAFFDALEAGKWPRLRHLRTGADARDLLVERIRSEAHSKGRIIAKFNHLTDPAILDALEAAAGRGARVDLLVRSTLTRVSPSVRARSLVGRFLEHARVIAFRRGGNWEVWAGSFDAMPRNFDRRYELLFPVMDPSGPGGHAGGTAGSGSGRRECLRAPGRRNPGRALGRPAERPAAG